MFGSLEMFRLGPRQLIKLERGIRKKLAVGKNKKKIEALFKEEDDCLRSLRRGEISVKAFGAESREINQEIRKLVRGNRRKTKKRGK